jgi:hypothetical protein
MNVDEIFADSTTRALIDRAPLMRVAYQHRTARHA